MPETLTAPTIAGLFTSAHLPVPLAGVSVVADIVSLCARVTITQRYVNCESEPIEAVYVFPLDEGAAVCGFEALIDGTLVVGEAMEREAAFEKYDDAMQAGHGAYLLDEERPDVFQASVGNLPPGKEAVLKITYVTELGVQKGSLRFTVPTTVSPRYAPAVDMSGVGRPDGVTLNPPRDWRVRYGLSLSVTLSLPGGISRIESPSHPVSMSVTNGKTVVTLAAEEAALDRDFVLSIAADGLDVPRAWVERQSDGTAAIAVSYLPTLPDVTQPVEVIFLVDESGSMQGSSIAQVRNALQLCLRSMIPGCRFNIVSFGSSFSSLFPESRPYDESSLAAASAFVGEMCANRGGTEILPALTSVLEQAPSPELPRQVVVLTDGQVSNTDDVIALARSHAPTTRLFSFGIGAAPSRHLVEGLARAGRGTAEFIAADERIENKVVRLFGRLLSPAVTDLALDWGGLEATAAPTVIPPVFDGARLLTYGFVKTLSPTTVRLTGRGPGGSFAFEVPIDSAEAATGSTVGTLAARARIRELEESPEWTSARASRQGRKRVSATSREIIDLAIRYGLASRETSLVAVERREAAVTGNVQLRRIPIALTSGWGGVEAVGVVGGFGNWPAAAMPRWESAKSDGQIGHVSALQSERMEARFSRPASRLASRVGSLFSRRSSSEQHDPLRARVVTLVALQRFDGSWALDDELAAILGRPSGDLRDGLAAIGALQVSEEAWATAVALAWLDLEGGALADEWRFVARKGAQWLDANVPATAGVDYRAAAHRWLMGH